MKVHNKVPESIEYTYIILKLLPTFYFLLLIIFNELKLFLFIYKYGSFIP